jgi:UDP-2,3-diacylglucosamine hydrolase
LIQVGKPLLLISDLHLDDNRPDITNTLVHFLRGRANETESLYILGDLFEVWLGDDGTSALGDLVAQELNTLSNKGIEIFLMHGNRDFLIGSEYAKRCGARLLNDPHVFESGQRRIALMHGDTLCTLDVEYMKFRQMVRNEAWQKQFLAKSIDERIAFAREARQQSQQATSNTAAEIMDVTEDEVIKTIEALNLTTLIHGHTHRPAVHTIAPDLLSDNHTEGATRVVLGDWDKQGWFVEVGNDDVQLHHFPLQGA